MLLLTHLTVRSSAVAVRAMAGLGYKAQYDDDDHKHHCQHSQDDACALVGSSHNGSAPEGRILQPR